MEHCCHARWAELSALLTTLFLFACSHSEFQHQHQQALAQPPGVELEIRTNGDRKQFAVSEPVVFEQFYTSKYPGLWHTEILEGWSDASNATLSDVVHITDGRTIWNQPREQLAGIICCDTRHWLSQEPTRVPYKPIPPAPILRAGAILIGTGCVCRASQENTRFRLRRSVCSGVAIAPQRKWVTAFHFPRSS